MGHLRSRETVIHLLKTRKEFYGLSEGEEDATMECVRLAEAWDSLRFQIKGMPEYKTPKFILHLMDLYDGTDAERRAIADGPTWCDEMGKASKGVMR